uniref:Uncharacterized protein n=1 Tax=Megaselia scalaris TaxID=36166 RepID=T1GBH5_MEGSC
MFYGPKIQVYTGGFKLDSATSCGDPFVTAPNFFNYKDTLVPASLIDDVAPYVNQREWTTWVLRLSHKMEASFL